MTATLDSVEAELARAHEAVALHREVTRRMAEEIVRLTLERDRALACEAAALGLLPTLRARLAESEAEVWRIRNEAEENKLEWYAAVKATRNEADRSDAAEARLSAATRVVEAAGALVALCWDRKIHDHTDDLGSHDPARCRHCALRAALREWKEGSGT